MGFPELHAERRSVPSGAADAHEPRVLLGLRGLSNLGNTCFMSCVLQILLHCPPVVRFFLSDRHNRFECMAQMRGRERHKSDSDSFDIVTPRHICLACEMDLLFSQCFSGVRTAFSPHSFLHTMWCSSDRFAGYDQQDAHEFLIAALAAIYTGLNTLRPTTDDDKEDAHLTSSAKRAKLAASGSSDLQDIFKGAMRSDVICSRCGGRSTKYEDFTDVSVDLSLDVQQPVDESSTASGCHSTLDACLRSFTRAEQLGAAERCWCAKCGGLQDSAKQLSIHRLPNVLCVHLKRFKHSDYRTSNTKPTSSKVDAFVEFPLNALDMSPHTAARICGNSPSESQLAPGHLYDLFGVAIHHGTMQTGHYTAFVRHQASWFHCDDSTISASSVETVRSCNAYMLFYTQKRLD